MAEPIISVKNLSKSYGSFVAVDSVSFDVPRGDVYGFLGPNGAGKSTCLRMLTGLITPTAGDISFFGKPFKTNREYSLRKIGAIIEKPDFYLYLSAKANLKLLAKLAKVSFDEALLQELLQIVGLTGRENDLVKSYSHGMKQRLGLAQALLHKPELIILDEPNTGLDPQGIIDLRNLILRLKNEMGITVFLSSHILSEIELIADSMAIINNGKIVVSGSVKELLSDEKLIARVEVENIAEAHAKIMNSSWREKLKSKEEDTLIFSLSKPEVLSLITFCNQEKIIFYSLTSKKSLEDFYLNLTTAV